MKFKYALAIVCLFAVFTLTSACAQDNWLGGTGNWSNGTLWSTGFPPTPSDNATIYSGGPDLVTLDVASVTINTLTLGGAFVQYDTSELTDGGGARSLTILNGLNVGLDGYLYFGSSSSIVNLGGSSTNNGATLSIAGTLNNNGTLINYSTLIGFPILNNNYIFINKSNDDVYLETLNNNHYMENDNFLNGPVTLNNNYGATVNNCGEWWTGVVNNNYQATFNNNGLIQGMGVLNNNFGATWNNNYSANPEYGVNNSGIINNNGGFSILTSAPINNYYGGTLNNNLGAGLDATTINNNYGATLNNMGSLTLSGSIYFSGTMENSGTLNNSGELDLYVTISNSGTVLIYSSGTLINYDLYMQTAGSTVVDGLLSSVTPIQINGGRLSGRGLIQGDVVVMGGTMSPGDSPGVLTLQGNYTQLSGGTFLAEIAGLVPGTEYDQLLVSGTAALDGKLDVALLNGFVVQLGDSFVLMTFASETGRFSLLDLPALPNGEYWTLSYNPYDLTLTDKPVPEPSSFLLLGSGLLGALGAFRRKSNL